MIRALLIEDEIPARADLRQKLAAHPSVEIIAEAATLESARALLTRTDYDLVFLDIQLIGGDCFDLVGDVQQTAGIIFVTAYDTYAVRAFDVNALHYLLKPVKPEALAEALGRWRDAAAETADVAPDTAGPTADAAPGVALRIDDTVYLRTGQSARFVALEKISVIAARDNYSEVFLADGSRAFLRKSLKAWEDTLPATHFMRVHRTQIVNLARVSRYVRDGDGHTELQVEGFGEVVEASRYRWAELRERLSALRPAP